MSVCFSAAAGKQAPPAGSQISYVTDPLLQLLGRRGGCAACAQRAAQYTEVAMALLCKYTSHYGAATVHMDSCFVLHGRFAPTLGTVEQNKHQNMISIYIYISLLKSIVRLHLTVELGLKHLGNNLHIMSTTASLLLPFPLSPPRSAE